MVTTVIIAVYVAGIFTGFAIVFGWGFVQAIRREMANPEGDWYTEGKVRW